MKPETYDDPATFPYGSLDMQAFRAAWRKLGPWHALIDRWRFDLGWHIAPEVCRSLLEKDRRDRP